MTMDAQPGKHPRVPDICHLLSVHRRKVPGFFCRMRMRLTVCDAERQAVFLNFAPRLCLMIFI
jgi:hypothetical protein